MKETNFSIKGSQILKEVEQSRFETKNGKEVIIGKVKCPLCGENMRVTSWSLPSKEEEFSSPFYNEDIKKGNMTEQGKICEVFTWTCPYCQAELKSQVKRSFWKKTSLYNLVP